MALPDPVADDREVAANAILKCDVGIDRAVADPVRQIEIAVGWAVNAGAVKAFGGPVAHLHGFTQSALGVMRSPWINAAGTCGNSSGLCVRKSPLSWTSARYATKGLLRKS